MGTTTGLDGLIEVVDTRTGYVQRVPADWLDNPKLSQFITKTLAQQALDGELPPPPADATKADLLDYAQAAGIDTEGLRTKADIQAALEPVTATPGQQPDGEQQPGEQGGPTVLDTNESSNNEPPVDGDKE